MHILLKCHNRPLSVLEKWSLLVWSNINFERRNRKNRKKLEIPYWHSDVSECGLWMFKDNNFDFQRFPRYFAKWVGKFGTCEMAVMHIIWDGWWW